MRLTHAVPHAGARESLLARVQDASGWQAHAPWIAELDEHDGELRVVIDGPRPLVLRLEARRTDVGISLVLIEGDASEAELTLTVDDAWLSGELRIGFTWAVPSCLVVELEEGFASWLLRVARAGSARSDG